jgi:hypothetical protein
LAYILKRHKKEPEREGIVSTVNVTWNDSTADWNTPGDWSDGIVPNNISTNATLDSSGDYTVSIAPGESFTVGTLLISDAQATLAIGGTLAISSGSNSGTVRLNGNSTLTVTGNFTNSTNLSLDSNTVLRSPFWSIPTIIPSRCL